MAESGAMERGRSAPKQSKLSSLMFCPFCGNMLLLEHATDGSLQFGCQTCAYRCPVTRQLRVDYVLERKEVDDVLGGEDAWKNVEQTEARCKKCGHNRAYFMQIQIRSADEPMSTFFKCANPGCGTRWREG